MFRAQKQVACLLISLLFSTVMPASLHAQSISHDGNRWYEIEISIFSNRPLSSQDEELILPSQFQLSYPNNLINLTPTTSSFDFDFDFDSVNVQDSSNQISNGVNTNEIARVFIGPEHSPSTKSFRISNFETDPFIQLKALYSQFERINRDINGSNEHRLLYHAIWRQPVKSKRQAQSIFIRGGNEFGLHNELEGSVELSYNINRVDINTNLWLNRYTLSLTNEPSPWSLPSQPSNYSNPGSRQNINSREGDFYLEKVSLMDETRQMRSNEFHYLDHPDFGLLVQIRPYELPDNLAFDTE